MGKLGQSLKVSTSPNKTTHGTPSASVASKPLLSKTTLQMAKTSKNSR